MVLTIFFLFRITDLTVFILYSEKDVNIEVDPNKITSNSDRLHNINKLKQSVDAVMSAIGTSEKTCPS